MKISSRPGDDAYRPEGIGHCRVWLEGAERRNVLLADEEGRFAITTRLDAEGREVIKAGEIVTDNFYGHVRIECPDWLRQQCERAAGKPVSAP